MHWAVSPCSASLAPICTMFPPNYLHFNLHLGSLKTIWNKDMGSAPSPTTCPSTSTSLFHQVSVQPNCQCPCLPEWPAGMSRPRRKAHFSSFLYFSKRYHHLSWSFLRTSNYSWDLYSVTSLTGHSSKCCIYIPSAIEALVRIWNKNPIAVSSDFVHPHFWPALTI